MGAMTCASKVDAVEGSGSRRRRGGGSRWHWRTSPGTPYRAEYSYGLPIEGSFQVNVGFGGSATIWLTNYRSAIEVAMSRGVFSTSCVSTPNRQQRVSMWFLLANAFKRRSHHSFESRGNLVERGDSLRVCIRPTDRGTTPGRLA
jgi:hypothetical protein